MRKNLRRAAPAIVAILLATSTVAVSADDEPEAIDRAAAIEEVVVTAQRREERNQDVPIAITAFSEERLEQQNIATGQDLNGVVPSLQVGVSGQATRSVETFTLRGQGPTFQGASAVVVYLDEVPLVQGYTSSQQGGPGNFVDLESLQVLAGPQGTLFGRNTTGGAVLLVPRKPTNELEGYVEGSLGNYDYRAVEGVINVPVISEKLLVRLVGAYQDRRGYTRDVVWNKDRDDLHWYSGRIGVTFKPTERLENYLMAYGARSETNGSVYIHRSFNLPLLRAVGFCTGPCDVYQHQTDLANQLGPRVARLGVDEFEDSKTWGLVNKTSFELTDNLDLNNIASYQRFRNDYLIDEDGTPLQVVDLGSRHFPDFPVPGLVEFGVAPNGFSNNFAAGPRDDLKQITEELQLIGSSLEDRLSFALGGFYYDQKPASQQFNRSMFFCAAAATGTCTPTAQYYSVSSESKALYGQGTLDLGLFTPSLESLRLTAGYRYTWDTIEGATTYYSPFPGGAFCIASAQIVTDPKDCASSAELKNKAPTWTLGLDYKPMSNLLLFAKASKGYKAGAYNVYAVRPETRTVGPEEVTSYEAGLKSDWLLGTVPMRVNVVAYSSDYTSIQRPYPDANNGAAGARTLPAAARIEGVELEATFQPVGGLEIGGNASYTDARYEDFTATFPTLECNGVLVPAGGTVDYGCIPFTASKWTYSVHTSLDLPVPATWGTLKLYANYSHVSSLNVAADATEPGGTLEPYGLLNLSASWQNIGGSPFDAMLFMTNATDELYRVSNGNLYQSLTVESTMYGEPRMYGLRLRYRFGQD